MGARAVVRMLPDTPEAVAPLKLAASHAFWSLSRTWLVSYCDAFDIEIDTLGTLFEILWAMVAKILDLDDDDAIMASLLTRTQAPVAEQMQMFEDLGTYSKELDKEAYSEFLKEKSRLVADRSEAKEFKRAYKAKAWDLREKRAVAAKAKAKAAPKAAGRGRGRGRGRGVDPLHEEKQKANIEKYVDGAHPLTQADLARICPPRSGIWNNWKRAAWCGHVKPYSRFKVDWSDGGRVLSGFECVREMWRQHFDLLSEEDVKGACPIEGLFDGADVVG